MPSLYDTDILFWSESQAALLRHLAAGETTNEAPDWMNIAEELIEVGRNGVRACRSLLVQAIAHELKARAWPDSQYVARWRHDADLFRLDAQEIFTPSMRPHLDIAAIYRRALRELPPEVDGRPSMPSPAECPFTLDELLGED